MEDLLREEVLEPQNRWLMDDMKRHDNYAYDTKYEASEEQKHRRALRNKARRKALKEGLVRKNDNLDIHHPDHGLMGDIQVISSHKNRSIK